MKKQIMSFKEYADFNRAASSEQYKRNVTYYDPCQGWVIDVRRKTSDK